MEAYHEMQATPVAPAQPRASTSHGAPRTPLATFRQSSSSSSSSTSAASVDLNSTSVSEKSDARRPTGHGNVSETDAVYRRRRTKEAADTAAAAARGADATHTPRGSPRPLPKYFLGKAYASNSYFGKRLRYWMYALLVLTSTGMASFWVGAKPIYAGGLYVGHFWESVVFRSTDCPESEDTREWCNSCGTVVAYAVLEYHMLPFVLIIGLPATGFRVFEPFKRDIQGRGKVTRSLYLQFCELVCSLILVFHSFVFFYFVFSFFKGYVAKCTLVRVQLFALGAVVVFAGTLIQITYFARFREHIKMQLGAFTEYAQTGNIRARMRRKGSHFQSEQARVIREIRKQLYKETDLGSLRDVENVLTYAQARLGDDFAEDMYRNASMTCGFFSKSVKNPLHIAAHHGNVHALDLLVRAGFHVNSFDKVVRLRFSTGDLFWHFARSVVARPVQSADKAADSIFKTTLVTPLHLAVSTGQINTVRWLI
ncbi:Ankyrin-like protein, partial [Globisporangium polare]